MKLFVIVLLAMLPNGQMAVAVKGDDKPVVFKSLEECEKVRDEDHKEFEKSLPADAQWELACVDKKDFDRAMGRKQEMI